MRKYNGAAINVLTLQTLTKSDSKTSAGVSQDGFKIPTVNPRLNRPLAKDSLIQKSSNQSSTAIQEEFSNTPVISTPGKCECVLAY